MSRIALFGQYTAEQLDSFCSTFDVVYLIDDFDHVSYNYFSAENLKLHNNLVIYKDFPQILKVIDEYEPNLKFDDYNISHYCPVNTEDNGICGYNLISQWLGNKLETNLKQT